MTDIALLLSDVSYRREQFRIFGTIEVVSAAEADAALQGQRRHQWSCLSDNAKVRLHAWRDELDEWIDA